MGRREWKNESLAVDDVGLYALRGRFVVLREDIGELGDVERRTSLAAIRAAAETQTSLNDIESAIRHAVQRYRLPVNFDWIATRESARTVRARWPTLTDSWCAILAGQLSPKQASAKVAAALKEEES